MGERSGLPAVLQAATLVVLAIGLYLVIDSHSVAKVQAARTRAALQQLTSAVGRLEKRLDQRLVTSPAPSPATGGANGNPTTNRFPNADLRDPDAEDGGRRIGQTISFSGNVNYLVNNEGTVSSIWGTCNDSLAERHNIDVMRFEPKLAEHWTMELQESGAPLYTITLRRGALWHPYVDPATEEKVEAREVTADDFLFWWEVIQNPKVPCDPLRVYYSLVDRLEVVDRYTFRVVWKEPYSLSEPYTLGLSPLPRHYYRPDPAWSDEHFAEEFTSSVRNQHMVGCGPYRFDAWEKGKAIRMVRFEDYYGPKPAIKTLLLREIKDMEIALIEFKKGNIDRIGLRAEQWQEQTPPPDFHLVTPSIKTAIEDSRVFAAAKKAGTAPTTHKFEKFQYNRFVYAWIGYNMRRPLFADKRVRRALTHCINRERIRDEIYLGLGRITSGPFVPHSPYYNHDIKPWPFDIDRAKALLQESGWTDTDGDGLRDKDLTGDGTRDPFVFTFIAPSASVPIIKWATIIQQDMEKAGIKVNIKPLEWSVFTQVLDEWDFDVCSLFWGGGFESDPYQLWHSSQADKKKSSNYVGYKSDDADRLIESGRREMDKSKRVAIYQQFHARLHEDQPYTFLLSPTATAAQSSRYMNARVYKGGMDGSLEWVPAGLQRAAQ